MCSKHHAFPPSPDYLKSIDMSTPAKAEQWYVLLRRGRKKAEVQEARDAFDTMLARWARAGWAGVCVLTRWACAGRVSACFSGKVWVWSLAAFAGRSG